MTQATTSQAGLQERLEFMAIGQPERAMLREMRPIIEEAIGPALAIFYERIRKVPETARFFENDAHASHAKAKQQQHWAVIASGEYSEEYQRKVRAIGSAHARLGLEPRWYIGGYALVAEQLIHSVIRKMWPRMFGLSGDSDRVARALSTLMKATFLDMELAVSIYLDALEEKRHEADAERRATEEQQNRAVAAMTAALDRLANGDLTVQIDQDLAPQFAGLKQNFNMSVSRLREAMQGVAERASAIHVGVEQISSASDDLSRRTEQQAANLEETAAAVEEITATVRKAAEGAGHARDVVATAKTDAQSSGEVVHRAVEAMTGIEQSSRQISQIIGVIDEIAFQTNLLALNAGVEAARAGEAGRGFAVVASEVRALAQRSAEAAKEIKSLISTSSGQVGEGVRLVGQTGEALQRIIEQVGEINGAVTEIASGAKEQATGLQEVNVAVNQMDQVTQQNAAMVEELTAASHSLSRETDELNDLVSQFVLQKRNERNERTERNERQQRAERAREPAAKPKGPAKTKSAAPASAPQRPRSSAKLAPKPEADHDGEPDGWNDF